MASQITTEFTQDNPPRLKSYTLANFEKLEQINNLSDQQIHEIKVVGNVLPFKSNNYVVEQLINWDDIPNDPMFILTFPQRDMLKPKHFDLMQTALNSGDTKNIQETANTIRLQLNPHPAGQMELNVPQLKDGTKLFGIQHKYSETCLFFPSQSQTCHAYCSFCFRWPQFVGMDDMKFAMKEGDQLVQYLKEHPEITDVLFTGGDPMIMKARIFSTYVNTLLEADIPNLKTIRIGTKALAYWPFKFLTDDDSDEILDVFKHITSNDIHLAIMSHFNHSVELSTDSVKSAISKIKQTGAEIRTQSPLLAHINDDANVWKTMWQKQVQLGCIPYYMFMARDTGAQHYFSVPLVQAYELYRSAYMQVSGLARTVRGPSMSATPGKVLIDGIPTIHGERVLSMRFLQGRNSDWVQKPFYAKYDENAIWLDELEPAFEDKFFFENDPIYKPASKLI